METQAATPEKRLPRLRRGWTLPVLTAVALLGGGVWWVISPADGSVEESGIRSQGSGASLDVAESDVLLEDATANDETAVVAMAPVEVNTAEKFVGVWVLDDGIKRRIENRPDGTASMAVELDFVSSFLYGTKMDMELQWSVEGETVTHQILSGEPKANVDRLTRDFGDSATYDILELTDDSMLLRETGPDQTEYRWTRVE